MSMTGLSTCLLVFPIYENICSFRQHKQHQKNKYRELAFREVGSDTQLFRKFGTQNGELVGETLTSQENIVNSFTFLTEKRLGWLAKETISCKTYTLQWRSYTRV